MKKYFVLPVAVLLGALSLSSCSESSDGNNDNGNTNFEIVKTSPLVDDDAYPTNITEANYSKNTFRSPAMNACEE